MGVYMRRIKGVFALLIVLAAAQAAFAVKNLAILEIIPSENVLEQVTIQESRHLTDELRKQAVTVLPIGNYAILTRDNIIALMPPDEEETQCLAESCAVDIGRAIGAEYVTQGTIGKFGKKFTLSIELYETMGGKLIGSIVMESEDIDGLLTAIRQEANPLFSKITAIAPPPSSKPAKPKAPVQVATGLVSLDFPDKKVYTPMRKLYDAPPFEHTQKGMNWKAWAMDIIGAAVLTYGFYQDREATKLYNDSYISQNQDFDENWKDVESAKKRRNIGYLAGGLILASGITLHIWF